MLVFKLLHLFFSAPRSASRRILFYDAPVILNDVACTTGTEGSILDCTQAGYGSFTTCTNIAVAQCEG